MQSIICTVLLFLVALTDLIPAKGSDGGPSLHAQVGNLLGLRNDGDSNERMRKEDFPQFMMDAYNCMNSDRFGNCLPVYHKKEVNLLRTFLGTVHASPPKALRAHNSKSLKNSAEIIFNVSLLNREVQTVHYSMLRLYKHSLSKEQMSVVKEKCRNGRSSEHINIQLYSPYGLTSNGVPQYSLCATQSIPIVELKREDWIEFRNITHMFKSLVNVPASTNATSKLVSMRLAVQCSSLHPHDLGFTFASTHERPQLVEFTENDIQKEMIFPRAMGLLAASQLQQNRRSKRDTLATEEPPQPTTSTPPPTTEAPVAKVQMLPTLPNNFRTRSCALYHYEIVFENTSFGSSIISPSKYNANLCAGMCYDHPNTNIENHHAFLQSAAHRLMPDTVPPPCCVPKPDKLEPIRLLTMGKSEATLQEYENMIATACECL